jgi:hypothetical protein
LQSRAQLKRNAIFFVNMKEKDSSSKFMSRYFSVSRKGKLGFDWKMLQKCSYVLWTIWKNRQNHRNLFFKGLKFKFCKENIYLKEDSVKIIVLLYFCKSKTYQKKLLKNFISPFIDSPLIWSRERETLLITTSLDVNFMEISWMAFATALQWIINRKKLYESKHNGASRFANFNLFHFSTKKFMKVCCRYLVRLRLIGNYIRNRKFSFN